MIANILYVIAGLFILSYAADRLVIGACALAVKLGVTPMVIGLTVVAFGTSLPELVISVQAGIENNPEIAIGNVVGSNIMNIAMILGIAALIQPIACSREIIRRDVPIMIASACLVWFTARDGVISRLEGIVLFVAFTAYIIASCIWAKSQKTDCTAGDASEAACTQPEAEDPELADAMKKLKEKPSTMSRDLATIVVGLIGLGAGAKLLLVGAVNIASGLGISKEVIALTLIAFGTSLPELATSVAAAMRGQSDIAVGNVVGSNIFNALCILGFSSVILPLTVTPEMLRISIPLMVVVSLACLPIMKTGFKIIRFEGLLLVSAYVGYIIMLFQINHS